MKIVIDLEKKAIKKLIKPFLILIGVLLLVGLSFGAVKANDYLQVRKSIKQSDELALQEKYQEAIIELNLTQNRWTFNETRQQINDKLALNKKLLEDQYNFNLGNTFFGESKWSEAKDKYSAVSDKYSHYKESQDKIIECQKKIEEVAVEAEKAKQPQSSTTGTTQATTRQSSESAQEELADTMLADRQRCKEAKKKAADDLMAYLQPQLEAAQNYYDNLPLDSSKRGDASYAVGFVQNQISQGLQRINSMCPW